MPTYEVTGPDGRAYEVNAPQGATQEQVLQYAMANAPKASQRDGLAQVKRVQFPDGSVRRIQAPAGASDADILAFAQSRFEPQGYGQQANRASGGMDPREELTALRRMAELEAP